MDIKIETARLKYAVAWLKDVGAEFVEVTPRGGKLKALAAVFSHAEVVLGDWTEPEHTPDIFLETKALQRFVSKATADTITLKWAMNGEKVAAKAGAATATFAQPAAGRACPDIVPKGVVPIGIPADMVAMLAKYAAKERKLSFIMVRNGWAYAHDNIAAVKVPATGSGFLSRKALEWGGTDTAKYYTNPMGSFVREPAYGAVLYESGAQDLASWPENLQVIFSKLERMPSVFAVQAKALHRVLVNYGALDTEQSIRIEAAEGADNAVVSIHGTKTVIEEDLTVASEGGLAVSAVLAISTVVPFLAACPDAELHFAYDSETSPYLLTVTDWDAKLLTPRVA